METVPSVSLARKHFDVGYALYQQGLEADHCQNDDQRCGWRSAQRGHMACVVVDTTFAIGQTATDADYAIGRWC